MLTAATVFAQMDSGMTGNQKEQGSQGMKMVEGMMKQIREKCQPMMKKEKMQKMLSMRMDMTGMDDSAVKTLVCRAVAKKTFMNCT